MTRSLLPAIAGGLLAAALSGSALAAGSIEGRWQAKTDNAVVQLSVDHGELAGRVLDSDRLRAQPDMRDVANPNAALRSRPLRGMQFLSGFHGGPEKWTGGKLYKADEGRTYSGTITLVDPDTLKLTGCVIRPLCRSETWKRLPAR